MYLACRYIQPNGLRCKARALKDRDFCCHHARLCACSNDPVARYGILELPIAKDAAAIRLSAHLISQAIINQTIDMKRARLLLYSLQISANALNRKRRSMSKKSLRPLSRNPSTTDHQPLTNDL